MTTTERTAIRYYYDANGAPVARLIAEPDTDYPIESGGAYCYTNATTVVVNAGYNVDEAYYTDTQDYVPAGPIAAAWERLRDEFGADDAVEVLERYARIHYPLVPIVAATLITGYSQGDEVRLLSWIEPGNSELNPGEPRYATATREREAIKEHHEVMAAVSRGQFWSVSVETPCQDWTIDDDGDSAHVNLSWSESADGLDSRTSTLALEEFWPWEELRNIGQNLNIPAHATRFDTSHEV